MTEVEDEAAPDNADFPEQAGRSQYSRLRRL